MADPDTGTKASDGVSLRPTNKWHPIAMEGPHPLAMMIWISCSV
jgi:hypothetical protein